MQDLIRVHYIYAQKNKTNPVIQDEPAFYAKLGAALMKFIINNDSDGYEQVVIIFDQCLRGKKQEAFLNNVKPELKTLGKPYKIYFHSVRSDFNGQIADYCAWAKFVSLERQEMRPITSLINIRASDFNLFSRGTHEYY